MALDGFLSAIPLFRNLSRKDMTRLVKSGHHKTYDAGTTLTTQDESGVCFFVITEGEARVERNGKEVRRLGPGQYFGEMALIDRSTRTASVIAVTELKCFAMAQWEFRAFVMEQPDVAWTMLEAMVKRVREAESS